MATRPISSDPRTDELANLTAGLTLIHLENVLLQAELEGRLTRNLVRQHKAQLIQQEYAPCRSRYCSKCSIQPTASKPSAAWSRSRAGPRPPGVLLVRPPGTGKTYFIKGRAREIGFNDVALNMQNILGGILGLSERNLARLGSGQDPRAVPGIYGRARPV